MKIPESFNVFLDKNRISNIVKKLAQQITKDFQPESLIVICVLRGGFCFVSDLIRELGIPVELDFVRLSSYGINFESSGVVKIYKDIEADIEGRNVLIAEEIVDSGRTMDFLYKRLLQGKPANLKTCALLDKKSKRIVNLKVDYVGENIEDKFLVGYGLDYKELYRNLPDIYYVK